MTSRLLCSLVAALALGASAVGAAELAGFSVPERLRAGERELVLNGIGLRTATAFRVKIYVAALYLETPSRDATQILASEGFKQIRMKYLRGFSLDEMRRGWDYSFTQNCPAKSCAPFRARIAEFQQAVSAVAAGDVYDFRFLGDRVEIARAGASPVTLRGREFTTLLLSTWIGAVPPTEELKGQLLGSKR